MSFLHSFIELLCYFLDQPNLVLTVMSDYNRVFSKSTFATKMENHNSHFDVVTFVGMRFDEVVCLFGTGFCSDSGC